MNELSDFELMDTIKDQKLDYYFGGVYSKDKLPKDLMMNEIYVINLQDHDEGAGTHWIVFYYNKRQCILILMDLLDQYKLNKE